MSRLFVPILVFACVVPIQAADSAPCGTPQHRQFDFWIGDWEVTDKDGKTPYGTNSITLEEGGCLLHEHWQGAKGGSGQSFNFYDKATSRWEQVWVAKDGSSLTLLGGIEGSAMVLVGDAKQPDGKTVRNKITWTPQEDGRVRQQWSSSADGGTTWNVQFDGWYRKAKK